MDYSTSAYVAMGPHFVPEITTVCTKVERRYEELDLDALVEQEFNEDDLVWQFGLMLNPHDRPDCM